MEIQDTRFWARVERTDTCWLWRGATNADGYGNLTRQGRSGRAHRYAWELATGETLTFHDTICHVCDIRNCVRNDDAGTYRLGAVIYPRRGHLYKATQPANVSDRDEKRRGNWATGDDHGTRRHPESVRRGMRHVNATLTDDAIRMIRASYTGRYGDVTALARHFGVSVSAIKRVVDGRTWRHVDGTGPAMVLPAPATKVRGTCHGRSKLNDAVVKEIRMRAAAGSIQRHLAADYGVSVSTICLIVNRKIWVHVL